jgi:NADPH:quinone reductase-like Zn-dependent oxidoreductase
MKAITYERYGPTDVLELKEVPTPTPKDNEVLIKLSASSVNSWDWDLLRGNPFIVRLVGGGILKPTKKIIGIDVAGRIEAVGNKVSNFRVGDEVFGDLSEGNWGGFAEYTCARESELTLKPIDLSFEEVATLPQAGGMALQGIRDYGKVKSGQKVLINGAGGGVGTYAIQLAKMYGAEVTAVDSALKFELMSSLGADHLIDYTKEDFTKNGKQYDFILNVVGHHSIYNFKKALTPNGEYRMVGGSTKLIFQSMFIAPFITMFSGKKMGILAHKPNKDLLDIVELIAAGKINPIIDKRFPLAETAQALQYLGEGKSLGKVVITI